MEENILLIEEQEPIFTEEEGRKLKPILEQFIDSYAKHKDTMELEEWLAFELKNNLDDISEEEAKKMSKEIIDSIEEAEENRESLKKAVKQGRSKESWFASKIKKITSSMNSKQTVEYLNGLDKEITDANNSLTKTITTRTGTISQNPNLDGFIAEQYHAQTFNLNAKANGSSYRAEVLEPTGHGYAKNSVDIVIKDANGKIVRKYQSKYCKDVKSTERAFNHGDYRGQRKLVAEGQEGSIKNASSVIEAPDGTTSNSLTKDDALKMRDEAQQRGKLSDLDWNQVKTKDVAMSIGKQTIGATAKGAAIGVGFDVAQKVFSGEEIEAREVVETALKSGADSGVKSAVTGAIKVASEKGIIKAIPKGTPVDKIANIAHVAIENAKVAMKVARGELTVKEGLEECEITTVSVVAGLAGAAKGGAVVGTAVGSVLGPVGAAVGGFVGSAVGYMAGSKTGEAVVQGARKIRKVAVEKVKSAVSEVSSKIKNSALGRRVSALFS